MLRDGCEGVLQPRRSAGLAPAGRRSQLTANKRVGALSYASFALETIDDGFLQPAGTPRVQISPLGPMQADFELAYAASSVLGR